MQLKHHQLINRFDFNRLICKVPVLFGLFHGCFSLNMIKLCDFKSTEKITLKMAINIFANN